MDKEETLSIRIGEATGGDDSRRMDVVDCTAAAGVVVDIEAPAGYRPPPTATENRIRDATGSRRTDGPLFGCIVDFNVRYQLPPKSAVNVVAARESHHAAVAAPDGLDQKAEESNNSAPTKAVKNSFGSKTAVELVGHTLYSLTSRRGSGQEDPAAILTTFKNREKSGSPYSLPNYLQLLQSEPLLFTLTTGSRLGLALSGDEDSAVAFYERLCSWNKIPYWEPDGGDQSSEFAELLSSGVLPPPVSRGHSLETEEPHRLVVARLQFVLHVGEGGSVTAKAFFTFRKTASGGSQRIFYLETRPSDWVMAGTEVGLVRPSFLTAFLYLGSGGVKLFPVRYHKMELLIRERSARQR